MEVVARALVATLITCHDGLPERYLMRRVVLAAKEEMPDLIAEEILGAIISIATELKSESKV